MPGFFAQVVLDDIDITPYALEGSVTPRLSRTGDASVKVHMTDAFQSFGTMYPGPGSYLKVYFYGDSLGTTPILWHHGRVLNCETTADENGGYTVFNSFDPFELWQHRPVRNPPGADPGNFANPTIIQDFVFGPSIVEAMMDGSQDNTIPQDSEGPLRLAKGSFAAGTVDLTGAPSDWPMTMAELAALLVSTGVVDIVITPIEFDVDGNYGMIDVYNGDFGLDLSSSVQFQYGVGAKSKRGPWTGPPEISVWFALPIAISASPLAFTREGSRPGASKMPRCLRASTTFSSSPSAFRLRGKPA